jgi:Flp pilus assembly CpaF family ATPase
VAGFLGKLNKRGNSSAGLQSDGLLIRKAETPVWPKTREQKRAQTTIILTSREPSPEGLLAELLGHNKKKITAKVSSAAKRDSQEAPRWMSPSTSRVTQLNALVPRAQRLLQRSTHEQVVSGRELELLVKRAVSMAIHELAGEVALTSRDALEATRELLASVRGKGPLQPLFEDPLVTDVYVDDWDKVRCQRQGKSLDTPCVFRSQADYEAFCHRVLEQAHEHVSQEHPRVDFVLADEWHSRVNMIHGSLRGEANPAIAIRIPRLQSATMYDLIKSQTLPASVAAWLSEVMAFGEISTLIVGPGGSGKTTTAAALLNAVGSDERVLLIEHLPELRPASCHAERLTLALPHTGRELGVKAGEVSDVVRARAPHRVVWGEVREHDRQAFIELLGDGYSGSIATMCGESALDALYRVTNAPREDAVVQHRTNALPQSLGLVLVLENRDGRPCLKELCEVIPVYGALPAVRTLVRYEGEAGSRRVWRVMVKGSGIIDSMVARGVELMTGPNLLPPPEEPTEQHETPGDRA